MSNTRINLQSAPTVHGVTSRPVEFDSNGVLLKGTLYTPDDKGPLPTIVVTGAWTTVKEQMAGTYARELAVRGFAAMAFDFTGWGRSGGNPRYVENPETKTRDIVAAATFLTSLDQIDAARISGLGICASAGYMAAAVADNEVFSRLALVAPWLHDPDMAAGIYGGPEAAAGLIAASEAENAADTILVGASNHDHEAVMYQVPYYTETSRGLIAEYDNKFSILSWKPWLTYDALSSADRLTEPTLMIVSPAMALPAGAQAYKERTRAPLEEIRLADDVTQFDFYDRKDAVSSSADALALFFR